MGLYVFSALLLPNTHAEGEIDLRHHYYRNHRWIHSAGAAMGVVIILQNHFFFGDPVLYLSNANLLLPILFTVLAISRNGKLHAVVGLIVLMFFSVFFAMATPYIA